jgi:hypothetical protein
MYDKEILDLFKVMVTDSGLSVNTFPNIGVVTNFKPSPMQEIVLNDYFKPIDIVTLFSVEERKEFDPVALITKQILHYIEVYGLSQPGLFELEVYGGKIITANYVRGVTVAELNDMVTALLYSNAPVKDAVVIKNIITGYGLEYDINQVKNNELRVLLFDIDNDTFTSGDDVVRFMCYKATEKALLIKSKEVIASVKTIAPQFTTSFLERHQLPLAQVFNRHKPLILAAKTKANRVVINHIGRLSKIRHVPIREPLSKRFISQALTGQISDYSVLDKFSVRDKFKFLNLLEWKKEMSTNDAFVVRNGKIHVEGKRPTYSVTNINLVIGFVIESLKKDFVNLKGKNVLLDANVDYGLPISRKQAVGNLPYGTIVTPTGNAISSGVYWDQESKASDLDLSTIDVDGNRVGWGQQSGYDDKHIYFSGDITWPGPDGAMEFMTSSTVFPTPYGLFINIFSGEVGATCELVVGEASDSQWIVDTVIREKHQLNSRESILGFVRNGTFVVYAGRMNNNRANFGSVTASTAIAQRGSANFWTVSTLFDNLGISYDTAKVEDKTYDYDLSYSGFSYDKLESLIG